MTRTPADASNAPDLTVIAALLRGDDVDAAIEAGLMRIDATAVRHDAAPADVALVAATQARLQAAWDARDRYRTRNQRLARIASERESRRMQPAPTAEAKPALPSAAAGALARALAKASGKDKP